MCRAVPEEQAFRMTNAQPSTAPDAVRPPLRRSSTDRMLGGVCGGLADYTGIDPVLWRVGMVALTLLGPGVIVYLLLWVLMPTGPAGPQGPLDRIADRLHGDLVDRRG
jgi:phage shock protein PspC (stress-responsive transcriptional regulator)